MAKRRIYTVALREGDKVLALKNGAELLPIIEEMVEQIEGDDGSETGHIYTVAWDSVEGDAAAPAANNSG